MPSKNKIIALQLAGHVSTEDGARLSSVVNLPLTPPSTNQKAFVQAPRILALFKDREAGRGTKQQPWTEFQLAEGEYDELERQLKRDESLFGFVQDKIRYDYNARTHQLVVRMPSKIHDGFLSGVEKAIESQLDIVRAGSDEAALFAQKVQCDLSSEIFLPVDDAPPGTTSKYEPDASFQHDDAKYPGVIIEVSYSHKQKKLSRLAKDYLLDSNANVQVVIGVDIEYGKEKRSRTATLSVWRTQLFHTVDGDKLRVVQEITDEAFRDDEGHPTNHLGLRFRLRDFAHKGLARDEMGELDREIIISAQQLCQYLTRAETWVHRQQIGSLSESSIPPGVKKQKTPESSPEQINSDDETRYIDQERTAARRMEKDDLDYVDT